MHASSGARAARARTRHGNTAARLSRVPLFMNVTRTVDPLIRGWFLLVSRDAADRVTPLKRHGLRSQADIRGPRKHSAKKWGGGTRWQEVCRASKRENNSKSKVRLLFMTLSPGTTATFVKARSSFRRIRRCFLYTTTIRLGRDVAKFSKRNVRCWHALNLEIKILQFR